MFEQRNVRTLDAVSEADFENVVRHHEQTVVHLSENEWRRLKPKVLQALRRQKGLLLEGTNFDTLMELFYWLRSKFALTEEGSSERHLGMLLNKYRTSIRVAILTEKSGDGVLLEIRSLAPENSAI